MGKKKGTKSNTSIETITNNSCIDNTENPRAPIKINTRNGIFCTLILNDNAYMKEVLFYKNEIENELDNIDDLNYAWTELFNFSKKIILGNHEMEVKKGNGKMITQIGNQIKKKFNINDGEIYNKKIHLLIEEIFIIVSNVDTQNSEKLIDELIDYVILNAIKKGLIYGYIRQDDVQDLYNLQDSTTNKIIQDYKNNVNKNTCNEYENIKQSFVKQNYDRDILTLDDIKNVENEKGIKITLNKDLSEIKFKNGDEQQKNKILKMLGIDHCDGNTVEDISSKIGKNASNTFKIVKYIDSSLDNQQLSNYIKNIICEIYNVDRSIADSLTLYLKSKVLNYVYDSKNPIFENERDVSLGKYLNRENCNFSENDKKQINLCIEHRVKLILIKCIYDIFSIKKYIAKHISDIPCNYSKTIVQKAFLNEGINSDTDNGKELNSLEIELFPELFELYRLFLKYGLKKHWESFKESFFQEFHKHLNQKIWKPIEKEIIGDNTKLQSEMRKIFNKHGWDIVTDYSLDITIIKNYIEEWVNADNECLSKILNLNREILLGLYNKLRIENLLGRKHNKQWRKLMEDIGDITDIEKVKEFVLKNFNNCEHLTSSFIDKFSDETTSILLESINGFEYTNPYDFIYEILKRANENAKDNGDGKKFLDILTSPFCKRDKFNHFEYDIKFEREKDFKFFCSHIEELQKSSKLKLYTRLKICIGKDFNQTDWNKQIHERCTNGDCISISDKARLLTKWDENGKKCYIRFFILPDQHDTDYYSICLNTKFYTNRLIA